MVDHFQTCVIESCCYAQLDDQVISDYLIIGLNFCDGGWGSASADAISLGTAMLRCASIVA